MFKKNIIHIEYNIIDFLNKINHYPLFDLGLILYLRYKGIEGIEKFADNEEYKIFL